MAESALTARMIQAVGVSASSTWDPLSVARGAAASALKSAAEVTGLREHSERVRELEALRSGLGLIPQLRPASP